MKLYLAQHGEAVAKTEDAQRPLSDQGRHDVRAMAALLQSAGVRVERVWHSGKRRAEQTARLLAGALLPRGRKPQAIEGIGPKRVDMIGRAWAKSIASSSVNIDGYMCSAPFPTLGEMFAAGTFSAATLTL